MELPTENDLTTLKEKIEERGKLKDYEIRKTKLRNPQIIIRNIERGISDDDLIKGLKSKNEALENMEFSIDFRLPTRLGSHAVITVDPEVYRKLRELKFVYGLYERHPINDFVSVRQCSGCGQLGHTAGNCEFKGECINCGSKEKHDTRRCGIRCVNCHEANVKFGTNVPVDTIARGSNVTYIPGHGRKL